MTVDIKGNQSQIKLNCVMFEHTVDMLIKRGAYLQV